MVNYIISENLQKVKDYDKRRLQRSGVGSRTMAKLSKNESVTTDTLAGICEALNCDIGDIATFSREPTAFSVYDAHKKFGKKSTRPIF